MRLVVAAVRGVVHLDGGGGGGREPLVQEQLLDALAAQLVAGDQRHLLLPEVGDLPFGLPGRAPREGGRGGGRCRVVGEGVGTLEGVSGLTWSVSGEYD